MTDAEWTDPKKAFDIQLDWRTDEHDRPIMKRDDEPVASSTPVALLPALADRVDSIVASVGSLSARIDALAASTQTFQAGLTQRLVQYVESTTMAASGHHDDLDEYRRATERSVMELRRATAATDKSLRTVIGRLDEVTTELRGVVAASAAPAAARGERDDAALDAVAEELAALRKELTQLKRRVGLRGRQAVDRDDRTGLPAAELDQLADAIVDRLANMLEVVPDDEVQTESSVPPDETKRRRRPLRG